MTAQSFTASRRPRLGTVAAGVDCRRILTRRSHGGVRRSYLTDSVRGREQLTWIRFPSPAPFPRQADTTSARSSQDSWHEMRNDHAGFPSLHLVRSWLSSSGAGFGFTRGGRAGPDSALRGSECIVFQGFVGRRGAVTPKSARLTAIAAVRASSRCRAEILRSPSRPACRSR